MPFRILIAEDDQAARSGLSELLTNAGYEVFQAATFGEARRSLSDFGPELLIADVRLGEFNGLQLLAANPHPIPTIVVTGFPDPVLEAEASRLGARFVVKPIVPSELLLLVEEMLAHTPQRSAYSSTRRWLRKYVTGELTAEVEHFPARVLDVSYGGLRLEIERESEQTLPPSFRVSLPASELSVDVDLVWTSRSSDRRWVCGAAVSSSDPVAVRAWCGLVDACA